MIYCFIPNPKETNNIIAHITPDQAEKRFRRWDLIVVRFYFPQFLRCCEANATESGTANEKGESASKMLNQHDAPVSSEGRECLAEKRGVEVYIQ